MSFWTGTAPQMKQVSQLDPQQQALQQQQVSSAMGGTQQAANYYQDLLGGDQNYNALAAPEMRQFREETMPSLAEQFAGMGAGGSFGGNFKAAAAQAGGSLAERLAGLRAQLRQQGAQGLMGISGQALSPHMQNYMTPRTPGFLEGIAPLIGSAAGAFGGPIAGAVGQTLGSMLSNKLKPKE